MGGRAVGIVVAAAIVLGGCGGRGPHAASLPGCTTRVATQRALTGARPAMIATQSAPFGVATAGRFAFVAQAGAVGVYSLARAEPALVRTVALPADGRGETLTPDGRDLLVAGGTGASVLDVAAAERGDPQPALGALDAGAASDSGAIEAATSRDGAFAFVTLEDQGAIAVFDLRAALASRFRSSGLVGTIRLAGIAPVGVAVSPDGRWLYATVEAARQPTPGPGRIDVIDVARAERARPDAVLASAPAGCSPVRVVVTPDGSTVWVSARASNAVLAFSANSLRSDPAHALLASVAVGQEPVGLALVAGGRRLIVADSDREDVAGAHSALSVIDTAAALAGRPALLGSLPAGLFPRELALAGRRLLVTNFGSLQLELVDLRRLP